MAGDDMMLGIAATKLEKAVTDGDSVAQELVNEELRSWRFRYSGNSYTGGSFTFEDYANMPAASDEREAEILRRREEWIEIERHRIYISAILSLQEGHPVQAYAYATGYANGNQERAQVMLAELRRVEAARDRLGRRLHKSSAEVFDDVLAKQFGVPDLYQLLPSWIETPGDPLDWTPPKPAARSYRETQALRQEGKAYRQQRKQTDPQYAATSLGLSVTLIFLAFMVWCSVVAFRGGLLPILGWHLMGSIASGIVWSLVITPIVIILVYLLAPIVIRIVRARG
jgi:hypothetical protein